MIRMLTLCQAEGFLQPVRRLIVQLVDFIHMADADRYVVVIFFLNVTHISTRLQHIREMYFQFFKHHRP